MAKVSKKVNVGNNADKDADLGRKSTENGGYLFSMSHAPGLQETTHWFAMIPAILFTAVVIMITRMTSYERPMKQFYFWGGGDQQSDFFSYNKMIAILVCASLVLIILLYRFITQSFYIKRSYAYIPMIIYSVFVFLSYLFSSYREFALWGWIDRFEGTLVLLSYMVMLFYMINSVKSEKNVKWIIYTLAVTSSILGLLGLTQALGHDFFRTTIGKKLITPSSFWDKLDNLNFTFQHNEIYQTVYNINYVSFYLTLLIPIFAMLFIRSVLLGKEEPLFKKIMWGALFGLLVYNLIGSASSGGMMGIAFVALVAVIILNKRILIWWKPIAVLFAIAILICGISFQRWMPELSKAMNSMSEKQSTQIAEKNNIIHKIEYMETNGDKVVIGYNGDQVIFITYPDDPSSLSITDSKGKSLGLTQTSNSPPVFQVKDERFNWISVKPGNDDKGNHYIVIGTDGHDWPFQLTKDGPKYYSGIKKIVELSNVPAIGWENNQSFGSGRGYIWSRTIPMLKDTLIFGHGADTYCIYFPQNDYVGKYNSGSFSKNINIIVDKPHDLYMGYIVGTGGISMLALLVLWISYLVQSIKLYRRNFSSGFISYAGLGIFLGICGFLVAALVDDSSVSVTPMFYGLLGTGIAINMMLKDQDQPLINK